MDLEKRDALSPQVSAQAGEVLETTLEEERKVLRRIDWRLMPILCCLYGLQFADKLSLGYAANMGLRQDTHLSASEYAWLGSVFYLGYLAWEFPTVRLLQWLPLGKYTGANIIIWGVILGCHAACKDYRSLLACRFLLGMFESTVSPAFSLLTGRFYKKSEQGLRTGIWFCFNGTAQIIAGCLTYGIAKHAHHGWRTIYVILASVTCVMGVLFIIFVPDSPQKARWLDERSRQVALDRLRVNEQGTGDTKFKWSQIKEACLDLNTYLLMSYAFLANIPNGALTTFFGLLISGFGYTPTRSLLLAAPGGAVEIVAILVFMWLGDRYKERIVLSSYAVWIAFLGACLIAFLPHSMKAGQLVGYWLTLAAPAGFVGLISLISSNCAGSTKKTFVAGAFFVSYALGNFLGPNPVVMHGAPDYTTGKITLVVTWLASIVSLYLLRLNLGRLNRNKERQARETASSEDLTAKQLPLDQLAQLDLTDFENPAFRYTY